MSAAEMAIWARAHHLTREDIHSALWKRRLLVKTSCMRQTLHLIPAADFAIYINALKKSRLEALMRIMSKFGITQRDVDALNQLIMDALSDGPKTQRQLGEQIKPAVGNNLRTWMETAWGIQTFRAALVEGSICYGPNHGKGATFVRVDHWLPKQKDVTEQKAKQILLRRYLRAYGPATVHDFAKWAGFPMKEARAVWTSLDEELVEIMVEDKKTFILREDQDELGNSHLKGKIVRLLPNFDSYLLGHADRDHLVSTQYYKRVYRNQGWISPVILLNGRVIGTWSNKRRPNMLSLEIEPFETFSKNTHIQIEEEATSLANFLGTSWEISFSK
ncbi:winged helix DNA-binding domain-containing protein [candidate division KSB1 bacterium]|nr:winged helix DNA-binding domain-containing protein [candidate division KSB1 bacterium]NIR72228.1 winged helix DNA-binding domain-containing protein [candidate division KSB1 bacterium]NIS25036.1 winged helix DNA-binding domain-containing protein [candidate division KSB1 bacterium]NIT73023.1 winged helix DNA-binding domain-containing protein [candidate division KSB1 bacterium]NIU28208.1 winged helix DNA-binding domain-containing protein [candidate division KSB1 bacterium]